MLSDKTWLIQLGDLTTTKPRRILFRLIDGSTKVAKSSLIGCKIIGATPGDNFD